MPRRALACALGTFFAITFAAVPAWADAPDAPGQPSVTRGNGQVVVTYGAPANDGGSAISGYTATCAATGGATGAASTPDGNVAPITVTGLTNGKTYTCTVTAANGDGASSASVPSVPVVPSAAPAAPTGVSVVPGAAIGNAKTGPLTVAFVPGASNGSPVSSFTVTCTSTGHPNATKSGAKSPIKVAGLPLGVKYTCSVTATNAAGSSPASPAAGAIVGAPAAGRILQTLHVKQGLALTFSAPTANGSAITKYRAQCTSTNGGVAHVGTRDGSPIVVPGLTSGATYTCSLAAFNARGQGPSALTAPTVVAKPSGPNLGTCKGHSGTVAARPGLLYNTKHPQTLDLAATMSTCTGPYVRASRVTLSMRTTTAINCQTAFNVANSGSGALRWTNPEGLGKSTASVQLRIVSTSGHVTTAHFSGGVTTRGNIYTDAHVSGNVTFDRGLRPPADGGDCTATTPLTHVSITAISMTMS